MEAAGSAQSHPQRQPRSTRRRLTLVAVALLLSALVILALLYLPSSPFRERHVSYDYSVTIEASEAFIVACPLPADYLGAICPDVAPSVVIQGDASVSVVASSYGEALRIEGSGLVVVTWTHSYVYRSSTQSLYDHYSNLSMLNCGYSHFGLTAFVSSGDASVGFALAYSYSHVYGSLGADYLRYEITDDLVPGWNSLQVDFDWMVS